MHVAHNSQGAPFVLIPGAGGMASYWHRVALLLKEAHQEPIAIDLPGDDASADACIRERHDPATR
jgi:pimeloyl-ACP methyl ester carboxylesterase